MIPFILVDIKLMCHNQFSLDDKKTLNNMRNMKMPSVLFKRNNPNVYNKNKDKDKDRDRDIIKSLYFFISIHYLKFNTN